MTYSQMTFFHPLFEKGILTHIELKFMSEDEPFEWSNHTTSVQVLETKRHTSNVPSSLLRAHGIRLHLIKYFKNMTNIQTTSYTTGIQILREMKDIHPTNHFL